MTITYCYQCGAQIQSEWRYALCDMCAHPGTSVVSAENPHGTQWVFQYSFHTGSILDGYFQIAIFESKEWFRAAYLYYPNRGWVLGAN
jgi:hypothetical protein